MNPEEIEILRKCFHDINNALVAVTGFAEMIKDEDGKIGKLAQHILESAVRLEEHMVEAKKKLIEENY